MNIKRSLTLATMLLMLLSIYPVSLPSAWELSSTPGSVTVHTFNDVNSNGVQDDGEENIEGWVIRLYVWIDGNIQQVAEGATDPDGAVTFANLSPDRYKVWEEMPECWEPTTPGNHWNGGYYTRVDLGTGQQAVVEFGNVHTCPPPPETCIDLEKTGPETAGRGGTITYHFRVRNCGDIILGGGAQVYDSLFGSDPIWSGDLKPGKVHEFDVAYTLPNDHCGEFTNTASAVGHPPGYPDVTDQDSWTVMAMCPEPTTLALEPDEAENELPSDTSHPFTATILDQYGSPVEEVLVSFSTDFGHIEGNGQYVEVLTDESGRTTVTVVSTTAGTAHIRAWVDDGDDVYTEGELSDEPSTKSWVGIEVWKTVEVLRVRTYDWTISKSVEPDSLELARGESVSLTYAIEAERVVAGDTYTVQGIISATNKLKRAVQLVEVVDCIEYHDSDNPGPEPGGFITLTCETLQTGGAITPGATLSWDYGINFTPVPGASAYRNRAEVTISNDPDGVHTFTYREPFDLPIQPTSEENVCATVTDEQAIPDGFSVTDDYPDGGWPICNSDTFTIEKTLTNEIAIPGAYDLVNTATVTEDSGDETRADTSITITVPPPPFCLRIHKVLDGAYTNPGNGQDLELGVDLIHVSDGNDPGWTTRFTLTIEVENCGNVDLADAVVADTFESQVAPRLKLSSSGGEVDGLRPYGEDMFGLDTITWTVGDLSAGQSAHLELQIETLKDPAGEKYAPTSQTQDIQINRGATVRATATASEYQYHIIATTDGITLALEDTGEEPEEPHDGHISLIIPSLPYDTPWAEATFGVPSQ